MLIFNAHSNIFDNYVSMSSLESSGISISRFECNRACAQIWHVLKQLKYETMWCPLLDLYNLDFHAIVAFRA
jgi:hypothetical protein